MANISSLLGGLGGSTIGASIVSLILDPKKFDAGLVSARGRLTSATASMETGVSKFGLIAKAGFGVAALAAVKFASDGVKASIEAREAQTKLANSIENSAAVSADAIPKFNAQAEALRKLTGTDDEAIVGAQAFLVQMKLTEAQVTALTPRIVDLAAKMDVDLTTAAKAVGRAVNGSVVGLTRMGVVVDKDKAATDAYGATLDALGVAQGFAAKRADDEPWRKLGSAYEELTEQLGNELVPALVEVVDWLAKVVENAGPTLDVIGQIVDGLGDLLALDISGDAFEDAFDGLREALAAGDISVSEAIGVIDKLSGSVLFSSEQIADMRQEVLEVSTHMQNAQLTAAGFSGNLGNLTAAADTTTSAVGRTRRSVNRFARLTKEELKDFKADATESLNFAATRFENLEVTAKTTGRAILRALRKANDDQREFAKNSTGFLRTVQNNFGPGMESAAEEMVAALATSGREGAAKMDVLAGANTRVIGQILREWQTSQTRAKRLTDRIVDMGTAVDDLDGKSAVIDITARYHQVGTPPPGLETVANQLADALVRGQS